MKWEAVLTYTKLDTYENPLLLIWGPLKVRYDHAPALPDGPI